MPKCPTIPAIQAMRNHFEYTNETVIDNRLKCSICKEPFQNPVFIKICRHDFCKICIVQWLNTTKNCPICRQSCSANDLIPNKSRIILDMLDDLHVKCLRCNQTNIRRGDKDRHRRQCPNALVHCSAADLKCKWIGKRADLQSHLQQCILQQIRPVIDQIRTDTQVKIDQIQTKLDHTKRHLNNLEMAYMQQKRFISAFANSGKPMTNMCTISPPNSCQIMRDRGMSNEGLHSCAVCERMVNYDATALHHCLGGLICRKCVQKYSRCNQNNQSNSSNLQNRSRSLNRAIRRTDGPAQNVITTEFISITPRRTSS